MRTFRALSVAAVLATGGLAYAQQTPERPKTPPPSTPPAKQTPPQTPPQTPGQQTGRSEDLKKIQLERASKLHGINVKNSAGESLGEIKDLALDTDRDRVAFVVLSFGGTMGMGDKLFAIPFESFEFNRLNKVAVLNVEKEQLKNAQGFDKEHWPNIADEKWATDTYNYYGQQPYWTQPDPSGKVATGKPRTVVKASDVVGMDAHNSADEDLGEIEDVVIELNHGNIAYAVLASGGFIGVGEKLFALPWQNVNFKTGENVVGMDKKIAVIDVNKDKLKDAPGFAKDRWPDLADARWMREVNTFYGAEPNWLYGYSGEGSGDAGQGGWDKVDYYGKFNPADVKVITGKITDVQHVAPMSGMSQGTILAVQDGTGKTCKVHLGPDSFVTRQNITLDNGDQVTINGAHVTLNGQDVVMARDIQIDGKTIRFRDDTGRPLWIVTTGKPSTQNPSPSPTPKD